MKKTARQILALIQNPISTVTHNLTQPSTSNTQQESVTKVPASLVTAKPSDQGIPPPPPLRGLTPPIKRVLPVCEKIHRTDNRSIKRSYVGTGTSITSDEEIQKVSAETKTLMMTI